jgi:hypothetical protein
MIRVGITTMFLIFSCLSYSQQEIHIRVYYYENNGTKIPVNSFNSFLKISSEKAAIAYGNDSVIIMRQQDIRADNVLTIEVNQFCFPIQIDTFSAIYTLQFNKAAKDNRYQMDWYNENGGIEYGCVNYDITKQQPIEGDHAIFCRRLKFSGGFPDNWNPCPGYK